MPNTVRSFYKYRPLYSDRREKKENGFTRSLIESSELFYATPKTFNDPFDCNLKLNTDDSTEDEWIHYIDEMIRTYPDQKAGLLRAKEQKVWKQLGQIGEKTSKSIYEDSSVL